MWRKGFDTVPDYNDNQGFCGGFHVQHEVNGGKCGICGDAWDASPRQHEAPGGIYASGIIVEEYEAGQWIDIQIQVTANHRGSFVFKICANDDVTQDPHQDCFDSSYLPLEVSTGGRSFPLLTWDEGFYDFQVKLPQDLNCRQCILQWKWTTANNWGTCANGTSAVGCGNQETFMACSDISVFPIQP